MQNCEPLVSIVIPVYKTQAFLGQCIESILSQTYHNLEIILVDDGSPDQCPQLCDCYAAQDNRIKVIHKENGGITSARKAGISVASGAYVMSVDSDDWIEPETIAVCISTALQTRADCVIFDYTREYSNKSIQNHLFQNSFSYDKAESEDNIHRRIIGPLNEELCLPQQVDALSTVWGKLYSRPTIFYGKLISEKVVGTAEDTIFNVYALADCKVSYINRCFYHYRKTNFQAATAQYKSDNAEKRYVMYSIMQEYIDGSGRANEYHTPFLNRVACGMIGLGLNEIGSTESIWKKSQRLRAILDKPLYREAFRQLDTSYCGAKWKLFFLLCKKRWTFLLAVLLQIMNYLRSRMAA